MFIGLLSNNFQKSQMKFRNFNTSENLIKWFEIQNKIIKEKPLKLFVPKKGISLMFHNAFESNVFKFLIKICIILNFLILVLFDNKIFEKNENKSILIMIITFFYSFETFLKVFVYKKNYFFVTDFLIEFIVNISLILFLVFKNSNNHSLNFRLLKLLLFFGLMRLIKQLNFLWALIRTLLLSLNMILNILSLTVFVIFMYSLVGCTLLGTITKGEVIDDYINFKNLFNGMLTLFKVALSDQAASIISDYRIHYKCIKFYFIFIKLSIKKIVFLYQNIPII